jgi:hypothetical protein
MWLDLSRLGSLRPAADYSNPDDVLAAAARLEQLGEWDAAIALYEKAAGRCPSHNGNIAACIRRISEKRALA